MGSIGDFLFGFTQDAKHLGNVDVLTSGQRQNLARLNSILAGQAGQGVQSYGGQTAAGVSPLQQQAFDMVTSLMGGGGAYGAGQDALNSLLADFDPASARQYWETAVKDPMVRDWEDSVLPRVQEHFIAQGAGSSGAANRAIAQSGADLSADLSSSLAQVLNSAEQSHQDRRLQALPQALDYAQAPINAGLYAGDVQRGITGDQLMELFQKWSYEQPYNNPWLSNYLSLGLGTQAFQPLTQGASYQPGALDSISRLIAALG